MRGDYIKPFVCFVSSSQAVVTILKILVQFNILIESENGEQIIMWLKNRLW